MNPFKVGDRIRFRPDQKSPAHHQPRPFYIVREVRQDYVYLDTPAPLWSWDWFELVPDETKCHCADCERREHGQA